MRKIIALGIMLLFLGMTISSSTGIYLDEQSIKPLSSGNILYVGGNGTGNYSKIQDAINFASDGDTVFVYDDSSPYYENVVVDKSINLIGEDRYTTQINGSGINTKNVIKITADNVTISGFDIENSGSGSTTFDSGIHVFESDNHTILNNLITYNKHGIHIDHSSGNTISNNIIIRNIKGGGYGVHIFSSSYNNISNNLISTSNYPVMLAYNSNDMIYRNEIINATSKGGIWAQFCDYMSIIRNNFSNNSGCGIHFYECSYNNVCFNRIVDNGWGYIPGTEGPAGFYARVNSYDNIIRGNVVKRNKKQGVKIYGGANNVVIENDIMDNYKEGVKIYYSGSHIIYHNNIVNNSQNSCDNMSNTLWDNGYPFGGNYWSDYNGSDNYSGLLQNIPGSDGIGDTPYHIPPLSNDNNDTYPLMNMWGENPPLADFIYVRCNFSVRFDGAPTIDRDGTIVNYSWDFGDGTTGSGKVATRVYSNSGEYAVTLNVTDDDGKTDDVSKTIEVPYANNPPNVPTNRYPSNGSTGVNVSINISWDCSDPDGDLLTFYIYFEANDSTPDVLVAETQNPFYRPDVLNFSTTYYWQVVAWDYCGESFSPIWQFTTRNNTPPHIPSDPIPPDNATNVSVSPVLRWTCSDPEGDNLTYNVYFEENDPTPDVLVSENQTLKWYQYPEKLNYSSLYYWKIVAWDCYGLSTSGPVWNFTTISVPNDPPYEPSNPDPGNGSVNIGVDAVLKWKCSDPDGDSLTYDVYLEANDPTPDILVSSGQPETTFDPDILEHGTRYYWMIVARDSHYAETKGPVWHFTTSIPDLDCDGSLSWTRVSPGSTVSGSFTVSNIGESRSLLDWEVIDWPKDWGTWTFTPSSGIDLAPEEPFTVNVSVVAPDEKNSEFTGNVTIVNKENTSDFCTIDVSLATPKNKPFNFNFNLLEWLFERFPILQRLLDFLENIRI